MNTETVALTAYDEECLAKAAGDEGLDILPEVIGPMSYAGLLALKAAVQEVPNRPWLAGQFRISIHDAWSEWRRSH